MHLLPFTNSLLDSHYPRRSRRGLISLRNGSGYFRHSDGWSVLRVIPRNDKQRCWGSRRISRLGRWLIHYGFNPSWCEVRTDRLRHIPLLTTHEKRIRFSVLVDLQKFCIGRIAFALGGLAHSTARVLYLRDDLARIFHERIGTRRKAFLGKNLIALHPKVLCATAVSAVLPVTSKSRSHSHG